MVVVVNKARKENPKILGEAEEREASTEKEGEGKQSEAQLGEEQSISRQLVHIL